jgi:predicted phage terminase large subunit-like protein
VLNAKEHIPLSAEHIEGFVNACLKKNFDNPAEIPECHREWWRMCTSKHKFVAIAAPRGHAKSTAITMTYTLANVLFRERKFILLVSDTEAQSVFFLGNIKRELEGNDDIRKLFGVVGLSKDTETDCIVDFDNGDQARIVAKGSEQKLRGINWDNRRPDLIICDDMENDEIVMNPERREKFRRWFNGALLPCRSRDGIIRYVGTILHLDSMLERLMPKEWDKNNTITDLKVISPIKNFWYAAKYKAHTRDFTKVLWPEYKDKEWLQAERANYISQGQADIYSQEYLNQPIDEGNSLFRKSDFLRMSKEDLNKTFNFYLGCDLAVTLKQKADFSAFVVGAVDEEGKLYIVESVKERMDSLTIVDTILSLNKKYDFQFVVVEKGSITSSILPMLNLRMSETNNYVFLHTLAPTQDKVARAQSIRARMRAGGVKFDKDSEWYQDLELEMMRFPRDAHDDQVDAISYLGLALDKFVEAPTKEDIVEEDREEEMRESGLFETGRSILTGY